MFYKETCLVSTQRYSQYWSSPVCKRCYLAPRGRGRRAARRSATICDRTFGFASAVRRTSTLSLLCTSFVSLRENVSYFFSTDRHGFTCTAGSGPEGVPEGPHNPKLVFLHLSLVTWHLAACGLSAVPAAPYRKPCALQLISACSPPWLPPHNIGGA